MDSKCTVRLPFDTEYAFSFKFKDHVRRKAVITIDGAEVANLIVSDGAVLERFMDSDKRFKFVRADNIAVADPSNPQNGVVKVTLYTERCQWAYYPTTVDWNKYHDPNNTPQWTSGGFNTGVLRGCSDSTVLYSAGSAAVAEVGATVEGGHSNQTFGNTYWSGDDGHPITFTFNLKAKEAIGTRVYYCPECGEKRIRMARFCHACGNKLD
jgi:hypothetical protein